MNYETLTKQTPVTLIEFYATWCPHCRRMMPVMDDVKEMLDGQVAVTQLDIDKNDDVAQACKVESVPTFIIYKNGVEQWRNTGEMESQELVGKVKSFQ
ncbi:MAG: thioredoxin family protein [Muribaculaceae bacterium]|nr:thioredoxin family protein [Muribaculaceae bacterium]